MTKVQANKKIHEISLESIGTFVWYRIIEMTAEEYKHLSSILEKHLFSYREIFWDLEEYKKLNYQSIESIPYVFEIKGFKNPKTTKLTLMQGKKQYLTTGFEYEEQELFNTLKRTWSINDITFRRKPKKMYFLLSNLITGKFTSAPIDEAIDNLDYFSINFKSIMFKNIIEKQMIADVSFKGKAVEFNCQNIKQRTYNARIL